MRPVEFSFNMLREQRRAQAVRRGIGFAVLWVMFFWGCAGVDRTPEATRRPAPDGKTQPRPYRVMGKWYQPMADAGGFVQEGKASWYGRKFHGKKTSSGEIYDMYGVSGAHKTLPLGTYVRVINLDNGREMDVRINDRGPFVRGRIIDLSYGAAKRLGVVEPGTARVKIVALGKAAEPSSRIGRAAYIPADYYTGNFTFQVGAFQNHENARRLKNKLAKKYKNAHITEFESGDGFYYRVRVGRFSTLEQAFAQKAVLVADGFENPFVVAE